MTARPRVCVRLSFLVGCVAASAVAQALTERQALQLLRESPYYRELEARVEVTRAERRRGTLYPNPSATAAFEGAGRTDFYLIEQPLAVNGRRRLLRQAGESAVAATRAEADYELRFLEADVRRTFQQLIYVQERRETISRNIEELSELVRILREREGAGEGSKFDRLRAERGDRRARIRSGRSRGPHCGSPRSTREISRREHRPRCNRRRRNSRPERSTAGVARSVAGSARRARRLSQ